METRYDKIVNFLLDYWFVAAIVIFAMIIMALPQLRDGLKMIFSFFKKRKKEFTCVYEGEMISFDVKLKSHDFDIVKIHATTHSLGLHAEKEWLKRYYPGFKNNMQILEQVAKDDGEIITFDIFPIHCGKMKKDIYFDITDFFNGAHAEFTGNIHEYAQRKIRDIYKKTEARS